MPLVRDATKKAGTQKCSPFPPLRTPSFPLPKNKECYNSLGEGKGAPFYSALQLSRFFRCSIGSTQWRLWGYIFVCDKLLPQSHRDKPCAQSARRQHPCCRHLRRCIFSSKTNIHLTQVALVARPCAPAALLTEDSSSFSRRIAISLCPLRIHLKLSKTAPFI